MNDSEFAVLMSFLLILAICGVGLLSQRKDDDNDDRGGFA